MDSIIENLEFYGYVALFIYSLGGGFVALIAAGILSFMGHLNLGVSILVAVIANITGSSLLFFLGRLNKKEAMAKLKKHRRKLALAQVMLKKYGDFVVIIQKFIYGVKTLVPIVLGLSKYELWRFMILNALGAVLWGAVFGFGSFYASESFGALANAIGDNPLIMPLIMVIIFGGLYALWVFAAKRPSKSKR